MITLLFTFTLYHLSSASGNRLLLQATTPQPPPNPPSNTVGTPQLPPVTVIPQLPPITVIPQLPSNTVGIPQLPIGIPHNLPPVGPKEIFCFQPATSPDTCSGTVKSITNPADGFKLTCRSDNSCANSRWNFVYKQPPNSQMQPIERIDNIMFADQYSGAGAIIVVDSTDSPQIVIENLECMAYSSCMNTEVILIGGSKLELVHCLMRNYCRGCIVYECKYEVNGDLICSDPPKSCFDLVA